jgi:hypothetical protein
VGCNLVELGVNMPKIINFSKYFNVLVTIQVEPKNLPMIFKTNAENSNHCRFFVDFNSKLPDEYTRYRFDSSTFEISTEGKKIEGPLERVNVLIHSPEPVKMILSVIFKGNQMSYRKTSAKRRSISPKETYSPKSRKSTSETCSSFARTVRKP